MIGLGLHAVFEGMAMGAEKRRAKTCIFALAILLHKGAAGMSFGISLKSAFPDRECYATALLVFFSCFTPIGVIIGMVCIAEASPIFEICFSSVAAGSFIYIACSEVIVAEFSLPGATWFKFTKLFVFILGVGIIAALKSLD